MIFLITLYTLQEAWPPQEGVKEPEEEYMGRERREQVEFSENKPHGRFIHAKLDNGLHVL